MNTRKILLAFGASVVLSAAFAIAADDATTQPSADSALHHRKLFQPYGEMTSLSDAQKDQIEKIHTEMLAQEKALHEKEETDILALLSDDQKAELKKVEENIAAARKEKSAAARRKKMEDAPTTAPAQ